MPAAQPLSRPARPDAAPAGRRAPPMGARDGRAAPRARQCPHGGGGAAATAAPAADTRGCCRARRTEPGQCRQTCRPPQPAVSVRALLPGRPSTAPPGKGGWGPYRVPCPFPLSHRVANRSQLGCRWCEGRERWRRYRGFWRLRCPLPVPAPTGGAPEPSPARPPPSLCNARGGLRLSAPRLSLGFTSVLSPRCSALPSRNRGPGAGGERGLARSCTPFPAMGMGSASRIPRSPSRRYAQPQPAWDPGGFLAPGGCRSVAGRCWRLAAGSRRAPRCARGRLPEEPGRSHLARAHQMLRSQQQSLDRRRRFCCFILSFRGSGPLLWRPMRRDYLLFLFFLYFFFLKSPSGSWRGFVFKSRCCIASSTKPASGVGDHLAPAG